MRNAPVVAQISGELGGAFVRQWNDWLLHHSIAGAAASWYYVILQGALTGVVGVWLIWRRAPRFALHRDALIACNVIGLLAFWFYPVAPPRMLPGYHDITGINVPLFSGLIEGKAADQFASLPSLHVVWALWVAVAMTGALRTPGAAGAGLAVSGRYRARRARDRESLLARRGHRARRARARLHDGGGPGVHPAPWPAAARLAARRGPAAGPCALIRAGPGLGPGPAPAISAHRGGHEDARAETYEAYDCALAAGADYLELDARKTGDGTLIASHRARLRWGRPGWAGRWRSLSYRQLCQLAGYEVPRLAQVLPLLAGRARLHLDVKDPGAAAEAAGLALGSLGPGRRRADNPRPGGSAACSGVVSRSCRSGSRSAATWPSPRGSARSERAGLACPGWTRSRRPARPGRRCTTGRPRRVWRRSAASAASGRWSGPSTPIARWPAG